MSGTAPVPEPVVEPVAPAVDPTPVTAVETAAPGTPVETAAVTPAEGTPSEGAAVSATPEPQKEFTPPEPEPSLFQKAGEPETKTETEGEKPPEQVEAPVAPQYEEFKLPEGLQAQPEALQAYTDVLGKHGLSQEVGQDLMDLHAAEIQKYAQQTVANQWEQFGQTKKGWEDLSRNDPEIGGSRFDTTMHLVALARDRILPPSGAVREAFDKFLNDTGVGNHPEFLRAWSRVGLAFSEPAAPQPAQKPPPDVGLRPNGRSYESVYNHPSSQTAR